MSTRKLSDAEVHPLVIESIRSMTREEAQALVDEAKIVFDRQEAEERAYRQHQSRSKSGVKGPQLPAEVLVR